MISWCDLADCGADALDNPRAFVPEDDRERNWVHLITNDEVRMAHAGRDNPQHNFVGARFVYWPAPGSEDTELGVLMEPEVDHGETEIHTRVQA